MKWLRKTTLARTPGSDWSKNPWLAFHWTPANLSWHENKDETRDLPSSIRQMSGPKIPGRSGWNISKPRRERRKEEKERESERIRASRAFFFPLLQISFPISQKGSSYLFLALHILPQKPFFLYRFVPRWYNPTLSWGRVKSQVQLSGYEKNLISVFAMLHLFSLLSP